MPAARTTRQSPLEKLREPFSVEQVKQRPGGGGKMLDYVPIETVLERLLTIAPDYSWEAELAHIDGKLAVVQGTLTIDDKRAYGIGAMSNNDVDMAVKSANSEAMKNAAKNGFGIALELWDETHRQELEAQRNPVVPSRSAIAADELAELKNRVADIAVAAGVERTGPAIAAHFGMDVDDLQVRSKLESIVASAAVSAI